MDTVGIVVLAACAFLAVAGRLAGLRSHSLRLAESIRNISVDAFHHVVTDRRRFHVFFHVALAGCSLFFVSRAWVYLPTHHNLLACILLPLPHIFACLCNQSTPSGPQISASTHIEHLFYYPPDYVLYHTPFAACRTCRRLKPARSKHCSLCGTCVARANHHCVWINNCLGRGNYKFFLGLLLSTGIMLAYGAYLACLILIPLVQEHMAILPEQHVYSNTETPDTVSHIVLVSIQSKLQLLRTFYMIGGIPIAGIGLLAALMAPLFARSLANHISLIRAGRTMNESNKWVAWEIDIREGLAFVGRLTEYQDNNVGIRTLMGTGEIREGEEEHGNINERRKKRGLQYDWPRRSTQFLVRSLDGLPPRQLPPEIKELVVEDSWQKCSEPANVENIYNLGFWKNFMEILRN